MCAEGHGTNQPRDLRGARCLVTGATGFVGRRLVARLHASGAFVRAVARSLAESDADEFVLADLAGLPADTTLLDGIDILFHLAAKTHDLSEADGIEAAYHQVNVLGTSRLLAAQGARGLRRIVFASSVKAIDEGNVQPADETVPPRPLTPYGRSKLEAEQIVLGAAAAAHVEGVCLRFPLVYGPDQRGNLERMIIAIDRGRFPPPPRNGNQRSMLHVENAVDALVLAGHHPAASGVYIVTDASPYSTRDVYDAIRAALDRPPARWSAPLWGFRVLAACGDLARRLAGRRVGFDSDALQKLLESAAYRSDRIRIELGYQPGHDLWGSMRSLVDRHRMAHR